MSDQQSVGVGASRLLGLSADLCAAATVAEAVEEAIKLGEAAFDRAVVRVCRTSTDGGCTTLGASDGERAAATKLVETLCEREPADRPTAHTHAPPDDGVETELVVPVAGQRVLRIGSRKAGAADDETRARAEQLARLLTQTIRHLGGEDTGAADEPARIFRQFHELTIGADDFEATVEQVLALGTDHLGLETGVVARIDETYTIEAVVDRTDTYTRGAAAGLEADLCAEAVSRDAITPLSVPDVAASGFDPNPIADAVGAYLGAPIVVDGEPYGTVNFTSPTAHPRAFTDEDREFVTLVARWLGTEIERERHVAELERDETILEAVGDPVYALDGDGRLTFLNEAAEALFGPAEDRLDEPVGDMLSGAASRQLQHQFDQLCGQDHGSTTETFSMTTASGDRRTVENRLAWIGDDHGAAGVLRDVTERNRRRQQLESFKRAIEDSVDGVAILDDEEFVFVDDTHVELYGFESQDELLGGTWRQLYGPTEIERIETEAFPELAENGHWSGKVRGHRPDGSTFPAEISLTIVERDRLVCTVRDETERRARKQELELKDRAMDAADVGIQITDATQADNPLVYVNDGFERITGYSREEAVGRNPRFLQGENSESEQLERLRRAIAAEEAVTVELKNYRSDGTPYWCHLSVTPVRDETGRVTNYIGIQQDITERREVRRELREQREQLELTLSETGTGIAEWDLETGAVTWNETLVDMFGRDITAVEEFFDGVHPGDRQAVRSGLEHMIDTGEPWIGEFRLQTDTGEYRWLGARAIRLETEGSKVLAVGTDITERKEREQDLARERERFRMLIESIDEYAFFITDETGVIQTWNGGAEGLFGYDTSAAIGMPVAQLYTSEDRARGRPDRILQQARIAGESADEGWRVCADGSRFYADTRYASLETDAGEFRGYAHIVRDMTERRRQRRRTELFVTESTDVVTIVEPDGTIGYVSRSVTEILGHDPDTLVGENLFDYVHPADREAAMSAFFGSVGNPGADFGFEGRFNAGDGEWRYVDGQGQNMVDEEAIDGLLLYLSDITDAKRRARRFEGIFNQTFQLTGLLDPDGTVVEANDTALAFGGFDRKEVIGTPLSELPWYGDSGTADRVRAAIGRAADGEFVRYETELQGTDGLATIDFSLKPLVDEADNVTMLVAEGRDITDRQRQRRQLGVMHRVIRHNMRNDLTKVRGWVEMLAETADAEQRAATLETVEEVLDKWSQMIEQMRQIQRILQADREQETLVDPAVLLERLADAVTQDHPEATVETTDLATGDARIPALVGEAVSELFENAIAASPTQTATATCRRPSADWLEVHVGDDGPGLPEMEARVLETGEETPLNHGEGLGLWLVRTAVTQVGGDVTVGVHPDGTDVCLRLPVRRPTDS